jgi:hypothetical protein
MPDVFGVEGAGGAPGKKPEDKKKPASRGEPDMLYGSMKPAAGEAKVGRYAVYDNETGEISIQLPPRFAKYKRELEEDVLDHFMGEPTGGAEGQRSLDAWIKEWIDRKTKEDPDLARPDADDS